MVSAVMPAGSSVVPRILCTSLTCRLTGARLAVRAWASGTMMSTNSPSISPPVSRTIWLTRALATGAALKSAPRSKRCEASGVQAVTTAAAAHGAGVEPCGFDEDVLRLGGDHGVPAAHDSGDGEWLDVVGDDEVFEIEGALDSIQGAELFAFVGAADDDAAFELVEVEGVGGLADGEGDVVGGVDRVRDGLLVEQAKAFGDEAGGGLDLDVAQNAGGEAAAEFGGFDGYGVGGL